MRDLASSPSRSRLRGDERRNGHHRNGTAATQENGHVATKPRILPPKLDEQLPVVSANGTAIPVPQRLPEHHRRFYIPLRVKLLFVALCSLGWVGFSLWLAIPWIEDLGASITVPVAAGLIAGIAIIPGYLNAHLISSLL